MAASDSSETPQTPLLLRECLSAVELADRLEEEVLRAERQRSELSCLLVSVQDIDHLADRYGSELQEQAIAYLGAALQRQLRRYDRVGRPTDNQLAVVLPGADRRRGEAVARRALGRMHAIKIELDGIRRPLRIAVGIAAWRQGLSGKQLLAQAGIAAVGAGSPPGTS